MMQMLDLEEIRRTELEILCHFQAYCNRTGLRWFLANGSLLGAIKYQGFIPWDDDVDVVLPRDDYERLLAEFPDSDRFRLFAPSRFPAYHFPFAKLCDMHTEKREADYDNGVSLGIDIDIFPLDRAAPADIPRMIRVQQKNMKCLLLSKTTGGKPGKSPIRIIKNLVRCYYRAIGPNRFVQRLMSEAARYEGSFCGNMVWPVYGVRELVPEAVFSSSLQGTFEGMCFPIPIGYDQWLRSLYGDYRTDPPLEAQHSHHNFRAYHRSNTGRYTRSEIETETNCEKEV